MWRQIIYVLPLALSTLAIKVPVNGNDQKETETSTKLLVTPSESPVAEKKQDVLYVTDQPNIDSYLIPPDPHRLEEVLPDFIITPATHFLPPSPEKQIDYYAPEEEGKQTDWYPIAPVPVQSLQVNLLPKAPNDVMPVVLTDNQTFEIPQNPRGGKTYSGDPYIVPVPSRQLEPPLENAPNDYIVNTLPEELEVPSAEIDEQFYIPAPVKLEVPIRKSPKKPVIKIKPFGEPTPALHLMPPILSQQKFKKPTKIYPKKVTKGFHPILIPISQFVEDSPPDVPRAKPERPLKPIPSDESEYFTPSDEKKRYLYEQIEQKRKSKGENEVKPAIAAEDAHGIIAPAEQETSETNYGHSGINALHVPVRHVYPHQVTHGHPVRLRVAKFRRPASLPEQEQHSAETDISAPPAPGDRTEFRMHGMKGPHSYQFGFDTGKGKNRQFRYEERDNDGHVKGHYGYMDKYGKLRVVNYGADPQTGFHADAPIEKE
ncbi:uncharacterized protein LOC113236800 isoform X2 [Hyposmocoma kahamanoa]|uniref:uncharacterized protein LOC113236800 isoform X2 n=1 Tax=Hyposmocoma kahamanoa TaxID=1477025 RepID=UPI000E6DA051|nr:uncharacterized protein LOC113236800 isoform X2 [Hyposmocoma kahamanoa]